MDRGTATNGSGEVTSIGVNPSRRGDETVIAIRRGWRFDPLALVPSNVAAHGGNIAKKVLDVAGDVAPVHVDVIGIGASVVDHLDAFIGTRVVPVNGAAASEDRDFSGNLRFANVRAATWWAFREALAPERVSKVALPRDQRLFADLVSPCYRLTARGIQIEDKADIKRRLGRSPDRGDAVVLAAMRTALFRDRRRAGRVNVIRSLRPWA